MINVLHLGRVPYALGLKMQAELVSARKRSDINDTLLLLEHPPVITLGRNSKAQHLLATREQLLTRGVDLHECDRGGDVTFHGPGQLVGYPIFDLFGFTPRVGAVEFIRRIEEALIRACASFGIATGRMSGLTGVWTEALPNCGSAEVRNRQSDYAKQLRDVEMEKDQGQREKGKRHEEGLSADLANGQRPTAVATEKKIAAIGVHISRGVTSHGFALNVTTDLDYFKLIVPCGIADRPVTSMAQELGEAPAMPKVAEAVAQAFGQVFQSQVLWLQNYDELLGRKAGVPIKRELLTEQTERA